MPMIKNVFAILILISSSSFIYSGNTWSMFSSQSTVDKVAQEISSYMNTIDLSSIKSRSALEAYIQNILNKNMHNEKLFPIFNAFIKQDGFEDDKNIPIRKQLSETIQKIVEDFIDKKNAELKLQ